jgi:hypothetical protein
VAKTRRLGTVKSDTLLKRDSDDSIQRKYLVAYLKRKRTRQGWHDLTRDTLIDEILAWVHKQTTRSKRPGGLGKQ